jgi:hypothetical protein
MCFVWISGQTAIISPYSINWLVFISEECVYCAVRAGSLCMSQVIPILQRPTTVVAFMCWSLSAEYLVCCRVSPCRICGRQNASRQFRPRTLMFHSLSIIPPMLHIRLYLHATLFGNTTLRILETFHKAMLFRSLVGIGYKITFSCFWRDKNKQASQLIGLTVCLINTLGQTCSGAETSRGRREKQM